MKRSIAMLLVFVLLTAMFPAVSAAAPANKLVLDGIDPALNLELAALPEMAEIADLMDLRHPTVADELNYIVPAYETYGMTVVRGEVMELAAIIGSRHHGYQMGVLLYEGLYEDLADDAEPVASGVQWIYGNYDDKCAIDWDTTGFALGDYTVVFCLIDEEGVIYDAAMCDVFVSAVEIPLERLGIFVLELGREADTIYESNNISLVPVRYPYHTTNRERVYFKGHAWTGYGASNFVWGEGISPNGSDITAYIDENGKRAYETVLKVLQPDEENKMYFERLGDAYLCLGEEEGYRLHLPEGASMEEVLIQATHPGKVEIRVEGDVIYVKNQKIHPGYSYMSASWGNYYAVDLFLDNIHKVEEWTEREATCTEDGLWVKGCIHCRQREQERVLPALGHDVAELAVLSEPTATRDGLSAGYCSRCAQNVELPISRIFTDTQPDWFYSDALDYCYENGIINGLTANTFGPGATLNRAQLVTMLYRHAGSPEVEGENRFTDVPDGQFYTNAVIWASANGIVNGYEDSSFRPGNPINRQELVTMLHRYAVNLGKDNGQRSDLAAFADLDQLMGFAADAMGWAVANGIINGISETQLGPRQSANRAQTVTILYRTITGTLGE